MDRKSSSSGSPIKVLEQADLYPYNYLSSDYVFKTVEDAKGKFERLRRISLSLHLYGHQTRKLDMAPSSVLKAASNMFSLSVFDAFSSYHGSNNRGVHASASKTFTIACPSYVQVAKYGIEEVADIRIKSLYTNARRPASSSTSASRKAMFAGHWKLTATTNNGGLLYVSGGGNTNVSSSTIMNKDDLMKLWSPKLEVTATSIADMNRKLSRLMYYGKSIEGGRDNITLAFEFHPEPRTTSSIQRETVKIPVYDVSSLVTIIVKTVGRIDKVIQLSESVRKFYSSIFILVADDDENIYRDEGMSREFYYLPLPNDVGLSAGRNRMIDRVDTDYFLTLDDDFTLDSTSRIGSLIHALETYPKTNRRGVGGGARNFSSSVSSSSSSHHHASSTDVTISSLFSEERFDIAGGKNPVDEGKFGLDFCGIMKLKGKTLHLEPGIYGTHADCNHVDFVPNIFLGRTSTFKQKIQWDELLKLGEHEDFFLRAKELGVKTLTCPSVTFLHDQVDHWLKRDKYEVKRSRVYDFWRLSLRKHGLEKLSSFGRIMMDLIGMR